MGSVFAYASAVDVHLLRELTYRDEVKGSFFAEPSRWARIELTSRVSLESAAAYTRLAGRHRGTTMIEDDMAAGRAYQQKEPPDRGLFAEASTDSGVYSVFPVRVSMTPSATFSITSRVR